MKQTTKSIWIDLGPQGVMVVIGEARHIVYADTAVQALPLVLQLEELMHGDEN